MPKRESKYDLTNFAYLKVQKPVYEAIVKTYGKKVWAETARDALQALFVEEKKL